MRKNACQTRARITEPLLGAVASGDAAVIRMRLAARAKPQVVDNRGVTPLALAHSFGLGDISRALWRAGARK